MQSNSPETSGNRWRNLVGAGAFAALTWAGLRASRPLIFNFFSYVFGDIGASWHAVDLVRAGKLPGVDFVYQYGAFTIGLFQAGLAVFGENPAGIYRLCAFLAGLLALFMYLFARVIGAPAAAWVLGACWVVSSHRTVFLSASHGLEPVLLSAAILAGMSGRLRLALTLSVVTWFVKPSMALIMAASFTVWILLDSRDLRSLARNAAKAALTISATGMACFAISVAWLGWASAAAILLPRQGANVYKALDFGFFRGQGSQIWHMPGATAGYYLGTQSASWLTINALLLILSAVIALRWLRNWFHDHAFRDRLGEAVVMLVAAHTAFVCFFYGLAWGWTYYAWLFWMALMAGMTWLARHCRHGRAVMGLAIGLAGLSVMGHYADFRQTTTVLKTYVPIEPKYGLTGPPDLAEAWGELRSEVGDRPALISFMFGYGEGVLGPPFATPPVWAVTPGDTFEPMFETWRRSIDAAELIVTGVEEPMLAKFPADEKRFHEQFEARDYGLQPPLKLKLWRRVRPAAGQ